MHHSVVIHHALTADGLPVNNLFSRWQGFIAVNRLIRVKCRHISEHKFIQQNRLPVVPCCAFHCSNASVIVVCDI